MLSHRLVHWSAKVERQDEVVGELFKAYFEEGLDIGDRDTLVEIAVRAGIEEDLARHYLTGDEGRQEVVASDVYARRLGINGVPCFIVNRKIRRLRRPAAARLRRGLQSRRTRRRHERCAVDRVATFGNSPLTSS